MKYKYQSITVPDGKRAETNRQILSAIASPRNSLLTAESIFNLYSGIGGLHGLAFNAYESFHDYTAAKKEIEQGQFFTPPDLCEKIIESLQPGVNFKIADLCCGDGNFFNYCPAESNCYGCEIEQAAFQVANYLYPAANIVRGDFTKYNPEQEFDMIVGNPPFNLQTSLGLSQYAYIKQAIKYLKAGGILCFIAPETFLQDEYTNSRKWDEINSSFNFIAQAKVPDNYFKVDIETKVMYFQKKGVTNSHKKFSPEYIPFEPVTIYELLKPILAQNEKDAARLHLYRQREKAETGINWEYKIKKYLYQIKHQKTLKVKYLKEANDLLVELKVQVQPPNMGYVEWQAVMLTEEKVAKWLIKKVKSQYRPASRKVVKLVKRNYSFAHKAYHKSLNADQSETSINEMLLNKTTQKGFERLMQRKQAAYDLQQQPYSKMARNEQIDGFLKAFQLTNASQGLSLFEDEEKIKLNEKQIEDLGLAFQKKYSILNWQQGGGKSVAGMAWIRFLHKKVQNTFIIAPALAVQLTWEVRLKLYGFNYILIKGWQDLKRVKKGQIILMSFDQVRIIERHLKKFIKMAGYKIALLVDESDELTNISSRRTQSMLTCFRKASYKILTTGTTTRNNINELYPQLELLYNNSANMICWADDVYKPDKDGQLIRHINDRKGEPFPAWRGHNLFKYCFCPQRTTVFGVKKDTQDIYNIDLLRAILERTVLTRTFDDIIGRRIYTIKTHQVVQNPQERQLYAVIIEQFFKIVHSYYNNTGNSRKESLLRLIRQIQLLIRSTSTPHLFEHYTGSELPHKFYKVYELLRKWNERVAIGTVTIEAAEQYYQHVGKQFPLRKIFYIDGGVTFNQRKSIIAKFMQSANGILISTQQSLKSSVNITNCDKCIMESLQWNIPKMSQYYFRFIRYDSLKNKEIHFLTYADTIEQNLLALLMAKEKLNEFVKTLEVAERSDLFEEFDIDTNILNQLIEKEYDADGHMQLRWGKQSLLNRVS